MAEVRAAMDVLRAQTAKETADIRAEKTEEILEVTKDLLEVREEMLEARDETIEATKELNTALLDQLDRSPIIQICVPGDVSEYLSFEARMILTRESDSVSRPETWENVKATDGTQLDKLLPDYPDRKITNKLALPLVSADYAEEAAMYEPVTKLVTEQLTVRRTKTHPGTKVFDTHNRYYLEGQAPDITITVQDVADVDSASVVAIIELKHKSKNPTPMASESFGQMYDYLRKLARAQPNRRKIVGLLSDLTHNHIVIPSPRIIRPSTSSILRPSVLPKRFDSSSIVFSTTQSPYPPSLHSPRTSISCRCGLEILSFRSSASFQFLPTSPQPIAGLLPSHSPLATTWS